MQIAEVNGGCGGGMMGGAVAAGGGVGGGGPAAGAAATEPCRFPKLEECAHFHYERVQLPQQLAVQLQTNMDQSLHSQHSNLDDEDWFMVQVTSGDECWLLQRNYENFRMLDDQLHQCIFDRKISQLDDLALVSANADDLELRLQKYLDRFTAIIDNSVNCGPVLNFLQMDNRGHRLLVPSEESRSINTPAVAAAYSVRRYVSQARDELNLEVGDMISVIDMASPGESMWWRGKRGFQVGFFPQHCVHIIGDKVPRNMPLPAPVVGSLALSPLKPVLRRHGKLITFFRGFILNRPSRRRLKQSGILKERVFGCDLGEHLMNTAKDVPAVLTCCAEFIEKNGIVDGIYRLSGVTSNIQKLRNAFDEDRIPNLYTEDILQDIHSVASLLKMYFRELPNPLCTYQLYQSFVNAVQGCQVAQRDRNTDHSRLLKMREAVQKLPPPHYRTLEYLMRHLASVAKHGGSTGMTTRNIAIVWAPNLLRCEALEIGGVAALQGVGVQAVVTEFLICYSDLIFCDRLPANIQAQDSSLVAACKKGRPNSLSIQTPTKLITLEEARSKHHSQVGYIEVGGGPDNLPKKYHTVIEWPRKPRLSKRSPLGWRMLFTRSKPKLKASTPTIITEKSCTESDLSDLKRIRTVKSAESLTSLSDDIVGPLFSVHKPPGHNRSVSHDSYFDTLQSSQNNSEGSLLDLSEIQVNFDLEESEMRIFSEDESLVSSPRIRNVNHRSPRVVLSPDSMSRKRTRLEDQLSDIQFIDCGTPDVTTAVVHAYQPKNKSPRSSDSLSLNLQLDCADKVSVPKSLTDVNLCQQTDSPLTPLSPCYSKLNESTATTPEAHYENILTTISITYKSPTRTVEKSPNYENVCINSSDETVVEIPTNQASLPENAVQPDSEPLVNNDKRKSCESETQDDSAIYQQVKYFRRSIHEVNQMLDLGLHNDAPLQEQELKDQSSDDIVKAPSVPELNHQTVETISKEANISSGEDYVEDSNDNDEDEDSLHEHVYENLELKHSPEPEPEPTTPSVKDLTNKFEISTSCSTSTNGTVSSANHKPGVRYEKEALPPCLRLKHIKSQLKTRSLDEEEFNKEFRPMLRRKSMDDTFSTNSLPKQLNQPKVLPENDAGTLMDSIHLSHSTENVDLVPQQVNNVDIADNIVDNVDEEQKKRERIEKYKEERRKALQDKYRPESFKEDKDALLNKYRAKYKEEENKTKREEVPSLVKTRALFESAPINDSKGDLRGFNVGLRRSSLRAAQEESAEPVLRRRDDTLSEGRRYDSGPPAFCIKDMKALFEAKSGK